MFARQHERVRQEDAVKHLWHCESEGIPASLQSLSGAVGLSRWRTMKLAQRMESMGLIRTRGELLTLTPQGHQLALHVVRAHRLWETFLAREAAMPVSRIHREAENAEHILSGQQLDAIADHLGHPRTDPHGDPIPTADGEVSLIKGTPLTDWPLQQLGRVVHLEDEPTAGFHQLNVMGLRPGCLLRVIQRDPQCLIATDGHEEYKLSPILAGCILVVGAASASQAEQAQRLDHLELGTDGIIIKLDQAMQGISRRRLLDLGMTPGTTITPIMQGMFGRTRAYRVRGTTIALRPRQATEVWVRSPDTKNNVIAEK